MGERTTLSRSVFFPVCLGISGSEALSGSIAAQAHRLLGHVSLDLAHPRAALAAYQQALALRSALEPAPDTPPIADICDSIACAYTEAGDTDSAFGYLERATAIHQAHDPSMMSRTLAIRAMTCLRAGEAGSALEAIRACWALQDMTQEQIEASRYPKHSGDIMLLARIYRAQGRLAEARELASRTVTMRPGVYGERGGPRVADSLFSVARMLDEDSGELTLAARLLREVVEISEDGPGMRSHLARALWFLAGGEDRILRDNSSLGSGGERGTAGDGGGGSNNADELRKRAKSCLSPNCN